MPPSSTVSSGSVEQRPRLGALRWRDRLVLLAPALACALITLTTISTRAIWLDEAYTAWASTLDRHDLVSLVTRSHDMVHATYYLLMRSYIFEFGHSIVTLRLPSVVSMALACLAVTLVGSRMCGRRCGLLSGFAFALLPVAWAFGTEARSFALATALASWATWALVRQADGAERSPWGWVAYAVLLTLAGYVFLYAWLVVLAHAALLVARGRGPHRIAGRALIAQAASLVALAPLLWFAYAQRRQAGWIVQDTWGGIAKTMQFAFGDGGRMTLVAAVCCWMVMGFGTAVVVRTDPRHGSARQLVAMGWAWLVAPGSVLLLASLWTPVFVGRYITFCAPGAALLIGISLDRMRMPARVLVATALVVLSLAIYSKPADVAGIDKWADKAGILAQHARPGDAVLTSPRFYELVGRVDSWPAEVVTLTLDDSKRDSDYLPVVDGIAWDAHPSVVWLVPYGCIETGDRELLASMGYDRVDVFAVGPCAVERYQRAGP